MINMTIDIYYDKPHPLLGTILLPPLQVEKLLLQTRLLRGLWGLCVAGGRVGGRATATRAELTEAGRREREATRARAERVTFIVPRQGVGCSQVRGADR